MQKALFVFKLKARCPEVEQETGVDAGGLEMVAMHGN